MRGSVGPKKAPEAHCRAWERFLSDFRAILGAPGPRKTSTSAVLSAISVVFAISQGSLQQRPKKLQRSPPGGPNEPQARPGKPQERPKSPQDGSKSRPERAKRRPRPPRTAPGEHPRGPSRPDASREPFGSPFWPHLGAPGASFSSFLGVLFEPRARSARQTKALVEITGQKVFRDRCGPDVQRPLSTKLLN